MILSAGNVNESKNYELLEPGVYPCRCIRIVDLGTHTSTKYIDDKTGLPKKVRELEFTWETGELMEDGRPFVVSRKFTRSLNPKSKLFEFLVAWRGRSFTPEELTGFDMQNVLGACCQLNVTKSPSSKDPTKFFNNVGAVLPLGKGMKCEPAVNETLMFDLDTDIDNKEKIAKLYKKQRELVESSEEWQHFYRSGANAPMEKPTTKQTSDDIPF